MAHTIRCADCGHDRKAIKPNTRYCHRCRLLRQLEFFLTRTRACAEPGCNREFAPIETRDAYCGVHALGYSTLKGRCALCEVDDAFLVRDGVNLCISCVRDPALRRRIVAILQRSQARRKAEPQETP